MTPGILIYRCRACGKLDNSTHAPDLMTVIVSIMTGEAGKPFAGVPVDKWSIHSCEDGTLGVSDLVGGWPDAVNWKGREDK